MFIVNVEGAIRKDNRWLIIERSNKEEHAEGLLSLVGGKVDQEGNSSDILESTLKREIMEEVNIVVKDKLQYVHNTSFVTDKGDHVINIVFLCEYTAGDTYPKSQDEIENVYWMLTDEILNHTHTPIYLKESIRKAEKSLSVF
ncbi:NUDIX domain-containing protein [Neobacillus sp. DY30]|uniref:NUDIX hydrolase n=1 Tax=Neobacillus sp. DY30 TaxID=3047871 RepID=UPI0024C010D7|nr:NUDIX domain-containing protein [Neobacillus sp. DY30]WHY03077.1 NUDIX domain-containing protein [Neobacillus sp. DY30]